VTRGEGMGKKVGVVGRAVLACENATGGGSRPLVDDAESLEVGRVEGVAEDGIDFPGGAGSGGLLLSASVGVIALNAEGAI